MKTIQVVFVLLNIFLLSLESIGQQEVDQFWNNFDSIQQYKNSEKAPYLGKEFLEAGEKAIRNHENKDSLMALIHLEMALWHLDHQQLDSVSYYAFKYRDKIDLAWRNSGNLIRIVGRAYYHDGEFESSLIALDLADSLCRAQKDTLALKRLLRQKSTVYNVLNLPFKSIDALKEVQVLAYKTGDYSESAGTHINMGLRYYDSKLYEGAINNFKKALEMSDKVTQEKKRNVLRAYALNNLANVYGELNRCDTAIVLHQQALDITPERNQALIAFAAFGMGQCLFESGRYAESLPYLEKSYSIFSKMNLPEPKVSSANAYATVLIHLNRVGEAKLIAEEAYREGIKLNAFNGIATAAVNLSKIYSYENKHALGASYTDTAIYFQDSIREAYKDEAVAEMKAKFESECREQENKVLRKQNELKDKVIRKQQVISVMTLVVGLLIAVILVIVLISRSRMKTVNKRLKKHREELNKKNSRLQEMNINNDRLLSIVAHDLRGPIGEVGVLLEYVVDIHDEGTKNDHILVARSSVMGAYDLLEALLNWAKNEKGLSRFKPESLALFLLVEKVAKLYSYQFKEKAIEFKVSVSASIEIYADEYLMTTILRNLLTNALKFTDKGGEVTIGYEEDEEYCFVSVSDTGIGMRQEQIESILSYNKSEMVRDGTYGEVGTGLGLRLVKEMAKRHGGRLQIFSTENKGTTMTIVLPKKKQE